MAHQWEYVQPKGANLVDLQLANKVCVVMGASAGLGRATAMELAREGSLVMISGRKHDALQATAEEIRRQTGATVATSVADAAKAEDIIRLMAVARERFGQIDCVVSNAGGPPAGRFDALDDETWLTAINLILMRAVRSVRAALPHLRAQGGGSITFIESQSVKHAIDGLLLSNSIRLAVCGLTKTLAHELGPENIRVNVMCPGSTDTARIRQLAVLNAARNQTTIEAELKLQGSTIPLRRIARAEEFGRVCAFIASPAASYVTGAAIMVDGGVSRSI